MTINIVVKSAQQLLQSLCIGETVSVIQRSLLMRPCVFNKPAFDPLLLLSNPVPVK